MFHNQKIFFVSIIDNDSCMPSRLSTRIWEHEKLIRSLLESKTCLLGRKTYEMTQWKGKDTWVITSNKDWNRNGIGIIHNIDDLHLFIEGDIYILGGSSLFFQFKDYIDEIYLFVLNQRGGTEPWIKLNMNEWRPTEFKNEGSWSYAHLKSFKSKKDERKIENWLFK